MSNPIDIANQIAAASQPLVAPVAAVAAPAAAVAPAQLVVAAPVAAVVVPPIDPVALVAEAAASGIVVAGAAPDVVAPVAGAVATEGAAPAAPVVPLTRAEELALAISKEQAKIDAATKRRDLLSSQLASIDKITSIVAGSIIVAALGRAETARQVRAVVTGIKAEGTTTKFKILVGEGFDATTEVINESQVVSVE